MQNEVLLSKDQLEILSNAVNGIVLATYSFPSKDFGSDLEFANQIASGQTLGFRPKNIELYSSFIASVCSVQCVSDTRTIATIAFPAPLFQNDIAGLLTVLFGKISFAPGIKLEKVTGDKRFMEEIKGPRIGLEGIRSILGSKQGKPLLMAILKPGVGPDDSAIAENFRELTKAGVQLVKDDEVRVDASIEVAKHRLEAVLNAGHGKGIYVMALNGLAFQLKERAISLQSEGAQAFLVCPFTYGISVLQSLCSDPEITVPIFAHPAFTGIMSSNNGGVSPMVSLGTLMRWAGADGVLYPSPYGSIALPRIDAVAIHNELVETESNLNIAASIPSAGILPKFVAKIAEDFGKNVVINAGTGMASLGKSLTDGANAFLAEIEYHYAN